MRTLPRTNAGFTLIELVMVIVILGILAAVALPKFVDLKGDANTAVTSATAGSNSTDAIIKKSCESARTVGDPTCVGT